MTEIFQNISKELKEEVKTAWDLALTMNAADASNFLSAYTQFKHSAEEQDFLRFYFNLQMESKKNG